MYGNGILRSVVRITLVHTGVSEGDCLYQQGDCGHLGLVHYQGDSIAGTTKCELGVVVVPGDCAGGGGDPGNYTGKVHHTGVVKEYLRSPKYCCLRF